MSVATPVLWTLPWIAPLIVSLFRSRRSTSLDDVAPEVSPTAPFVSIVVPARNERRNIERCVRSILGSDYPQFELIVVDDHSTDGTGDVARSIAAADSRLRVIEAPELPAGWFGKQWACHTGAAKATGEIVVFTDADTHHSHDLIPRVVAAMRDRKADLLSVAGQQEMHSFWELVIQPQMFSLLLFRYGGTEHVSSAKRAVDVIANGQFIAVKREAYDAVGGHALVRDRVAEDMAMAQEFHRARRRVVLMLGMTQLSTHMYASLAELIGGWRKNIYAGGRSASLGGAVGRAFYPALLLSVPLFGLAPPIALVFALLGIASTPWLTWSAICVVIAVVYWAAIYRFTKAPIAYVLLYPLGLVMLAHIAIGAIARGQRVEWKEREYVSR